MAKNGLRVWPKVCIFVFDTFNRLFLAFTAVVCFDLSNFRADFFKTRFSRNQYLRFPDAISLEEISETTLNFAIELDIFFSRK